MIGPAICGERTETTGERRENRNEGDQKPDAAVPVLSKPQSALEEALKALREKVETSSEYVGDDFVREARAIHIGDAPDRSIYGEARLDEAVALIEEGIPLTPLPFRAKRTTS